MYLYRHRSILAYIDTPLFDYIDCIDPFKPLLEFLTHTVYYWSTLNTTGELSAPCPFVRLCVQQ